MRLNGISLSIILIFIFSCNVQAQEGRLPVAILNLELSGIDSSAAGTLSDRLRAELLNTGQFDVMERNHMEEILIEQGFQQTGACNTDECIIEAGRLLGVSHMIAGSIGKLGTLYTVTLRLIDVETGRILLIVTEDSQGPIENVLTVSLKNVSKKLATLTAEIDKTTLGFGSLKLSSNPIGARVFLDDQSIAGVTPLEIDSIKAGIHIVRIQKELLGSSKAIFIAPNEITNVEFELTMAKGLLKIITEPDAVEIFLDSKFVDSSPKRLIDLPVGSYYLKLAKKGYVDYTQIISIKENETTMVSTKMIPLSYLTVTANPPDCYVFVDDSLIGVTPITSYNVKPGFHKIKIGKKGFVDFEETRSLPSGQTTTFDVVLDAVATLIVTSEPPEVELYMDGMYQGLTPLEVSNLKPGVINIKLKKELYNDYLSQIILEKGATRNLNITMVKKRGKLIIQSIPSEAILEVDGTKRGNTPIEINDIEFGRHLLRAMKNGYEDYEETIEINNNLPHVVNINFKLAKGTIFLHANPKDAVIFLDGKKLDQIPADGIKLFPGEYNVTAKRPGYEKYTTTAVIKPHDGYALELPLNKKTKQKAVIRSMIFPGWGQSYAEKHTRKIIFPLLEISSFACILITKSNYDNKISNYRDIRDRYLNAIDEQEIDRLRTDMDTAYDDAKSVKNLQQKFIIAAIGIWALNILDSALFEPVRPVVIPDQYGLNYSLKF